MIRVTNVDFQKLINLLKKEAMDGATLTFKETGRSLTVETVDRQGKNILIEISDTEYPFMPRMTKTETF